MKTSKFPVISLLILLCAFFTLPINAQVGIGTTNPNSTSMLDIQSNAKGVLIPRMETTDRTGISSPANGLLVFDTDTQSFWFYDASAWRELGIGSSIHDTDGDTKIEVEKVTDTDPDGDEINFTTRNAERMKIGNDGITKIGDIAGGNDTKIEADGSLSYEGTATRYDDLRVPVNSTTRSGTNDPTWRRLLQNGSSQGVFLQWFDDSTQEELYFVVQMPHAWKEGTDIYPHVHWTAFNDVGSLKVVWALEYTWSNVGGVFETPTIIKGLDPITSIGTVSAYEHAITSLGTILGSGKTLSSVLICRIFRDTTDSADTFDNLSDPGDSAGLIEIDFHYQIDSDGSKEEFTK
ncbi:hypothetical protein [Yeosuana marina]|uniref:hypothetical protein n=1 Tax=Yeosuana marina TaxID=1565536 RepID=UPI0030EF6320|tara:strand:+ start:2869 stop:3915 length:1047 start_codon:yes stop_codon:yes gene_type:complete